MNQQDSNEYHILYPSIYQAFAQMNPSDLERIVKQAEEKVERKEVTRKEVLHALYKNSELVQPSMGTSSNVFI